MPLLEKGKGEWVNEFWFFTREREREIKRRGRKEGRGKRGVHFRHKKKRRKETKKYYGLPREL